MRQLTWVWLVCCCAALKNEVWLTSSPKNTIKARYAGMFSLTGHAVVSGASLSWPGCDRTSKSLSWLRPAKTSTADCPARSIQTLSLTFGLVIIVIRKLALLHLMFEMFWNHIFGVAFSCLFSGGDEWGVGCRNTSDILSSLMNNNTSQQAPH